VDGNSYSSTQTFSWVAGSNHTIAVTSPQSGGTGIQYVWSKWNDDGAISHVVAPTTDTNFIAKFQQQYFLTMSAGSAGQVRPTSGWYKTGQVVTIEARANQGFHFVNWTGTGPGSYSGTDNPALVTMLGPITENASFTPGSGTTKGFAWVRIPYP
jgi:Divergent InlB B-repeat domain